jgi:signal transduction histidine kinase
MTTDQTPEERIAELTRENEQLRQQNSIKSDWISISAHQLRTSLSAIKWILKMFMDGDFGKLTPEQEGFMKKAFDSNERMLVIVNDMLSMSSIEETIIDYTFTPHNMVSLIDTVLFDFTSESYKKGVEIIFLKPESPLPDLSIDLEKIRVVLQNLVENAIKYTDKGGRIVISVSKNDNDMVEVRVKDTGIGIPQSEQEKIFEKFYRATNAKTIHAVGTGLGLFTTKAIIERHGGAMWFESIEGEGTTFFFTLPLSR